MSEDTEDKPLTKRERRALAKEKKKEEQAKVQMQGNVKKWGVAIVIALFAGFLGFKFVEWVRTPEPEVVTQEAVVITTSDQVKGSPEARVELIEYGDFQCPACADYASQVKQLADDFPDDLKIAFRHFPLTSIHRNAEAAAYAAEAAGKQDKFWEMHDMLYANQADWSEEGNVDEIFEGYVEELELDIEVYKVDIESEEVKANVDSDLAGARALRVNSTPTFYLNGVKIQPGSYDDFKGLVEAEIQGYTVE